MGVDKEEAHVAEPCIHRIMGADLSFVTVGLSFTVAKGFSPLKRKCRKLLEGFLQSKPKLIHSGPSSKVSSNSKLWF